MENFGRVRNKLERFIRKYYLNQILKGSLLFISTGLLYFLIVIGLEYFLWLSTLGRSILFWIFILVELILLIRFIGIPLLKLLKFSNGINEFQAAEIIGEHFPEVNDKLKNLLQLRESSKKSDLLLASIDQRSKELTPIPFSSAIDYRRNRKYIKFAVFPILIILGVIIAGKADFITQSFSRISDYNTVYLKPAPFQFIIQNSTLESREGEPYKLQVKTLGDYNPENVKLLEANAENFMKQTAPGVFEYTFSEISRDVDFHLISNEVVSREYTINMIEVPKLLNFSMQIDYPSYTGVSNEELSGTGNITVPEGTNISWIFNTKNVSYLNFKTDDSLYKLSPRSDHIEFQKSVRENYPYSISSSNERIMDYEQLDYTVKVIKDKYPEIQVEARRDSLNTDIQYFKGNVSDDYGLSRLDLVYYTNDNEEAPKRVAIPVSREGFDEFHYVFPGNLDLKEGENYMFYFRVLDNDAVNGAKSAQSQTYTFHNKTREELEKENLEEQNDAIENIGEKLDEFKRSDEELKEISRIEKEEDELNYNDRKKLEEFIKRQKQQNEMMKNYSEKLEKSLQKNNENSLMKEELNKRLDNNEKRLQENESLLEELEKYSEKIQKEDLGKKLEELSKKNRNSQRSLEQLLELTKNYYVEEKKQKLARDLENLGEEQEELSRKEEVENTLEEQSKLNKKFENFQKEMDQLEKENEKLKQPKDLGREEVDEESIKKDQEDAKENLEQQNNSDAKKQQQDAGKKMKEMGGAMQEMAMQQEMQQLEADAESLRQILDNLITFSFEQEELLRNFKVLQQNNPAYAGKLKNQSNLRENFNHIDDSLYTLALRNPMINEAITSELTNIEFDLEKAIERLSENEIPQGTASQQYVVTGANDLANLLDNILSSMQQMMANPQAGSGNSGQEFQLDDIIKKQKKLGEKMEKGAESKPQSPGEPGQEKMGEGESGELYEIYKEQQMLRMKMEELLKNEGLKNANDPSEKMKELEEQLLDKGFDPETVKRMQQLEYELLKFDEAHKLQGTDNKRTSETNRIDYENRLNNQIDRAKEYFNSTEILNRQILPLRQIYREKVKEYFGTGRD